MADGDAPAGMDIGTAYLQIVPSARGFGAALNKQINEQVKSVSIEQGATAGKSLGQAFMGAWAESSKKEGATVRSRIIEVLNNPELTRAVDAPGTRIGDRLGKVLTLGLRDSSKGISKEIGSEVDKAGKEATKSAGRFNLGNALMGGAAFGVAGAAISGVIGIVKSYAGQATEAADATLKFQNTLKFAGIKPDQIKTVTDQTQKYADQTVYSLSDIQSMTAQLASNGVKNYEGLAEAAGNLNAVAGGNADTFKSVGMVMTQTAGAGKLTTDNWNQLADAIPGASGKLQQALQKNGAYTGNFRNAMEKGQISAEEFNKAVMQLGSTDIAKSAATSTQTFEGAWGNLQATIVGGLGKIMTTLRPAATQIMGLFSRALVPVFSGINSGISLAIGALGQLGKWLQSTGIGAWARGVVASLGSVSRSGSGITSAFRPVVAWINGTFKPALAGVVGAVRGLVAAVIPIVQQLASGMIARIRPLLPMVRQIFSQIASVVTSALGLVREVIVRATQLISAIWRRWGTTLMNFTGSSMRNILTAISNVLNIVKNVFQLFSNLLQGRWGAMWHNLVSITSSLGRIVGALIKELWATIKGAFFTGIAAVKLAWSGLWNLVKSVASAAWGWFTGNIARPLISMFTSTLTSALRKFGAGFSSVWNGIKAAAAKPVNFVINTVWNNGLRKALNLIPGVNMGAASPIPGFRKGGYTGDVGPDKVAGIVHGNEFVMDAETTRLGGGRAGMERIRAALRAGGLKTNIEDVIKRGPKGPAGQGGPSEDAIARGWALSHSAENWHERCLNFVNRAWGGTVPRLGVATAKQAALAGPVNMVDVPPPGAAVFMNTSAAGHATLSVGGGSVLSTDWGGRGRVGLASVGDIVSRWSAPYMGWWHPILGTGGHESFGSKVKGLIGNAAHNIKGAASWMGNKVVSAGSWLGHEAESLFDFNPVKSLINGVKNKALAGLNATPFGKVIAKAVPTVFSKALSWAKDKAKQVLGFGGDSGSPVSGSGPAAFEGWWKQAVAIDPSLAPYHNAATIIAKNESGFNPNAVNNWDSNARAGTPSKGLMQFIEPTFQRYAFPGHTNFMSPIDQLLAWRRYTTAQYGSPNNTPGIRSLGRGRGYVGYENGTTNATAGWHWVGERGPELMRFRGGEQVMDNRSSMRAVQGGPQVVINGSVGYDPAGLLREIRDENARQQARSGLRQAMAGL